MQFEIGVLKMQNPKMRDRQAANVKFEKTDALNRREWRQYCCSFLYQDLRTNPWPEFQDRSIFRNQTS